MDLGGPANWLAKRFEKEERVAGSRRGGRSVKRGGVERRTLPGVAKRPRLFKLAPLLRVVSYRSPREPWQKIIKTWKNCKR